MLGVVQPRHDCGGESGVLAQRGWSCFPNNDSNVEEI